MKKVLLLLLLAGLFGFYEVQKRIEAPGPLNEEAFVLIPKGASSRLAAVVLDEAGVIDNPLLLRFYMRLKGHDKQLKAGEYRFTAGVSMRQAVQKMVSGDIYYRRLTLPEGLTSKQMLDIIGSEEMLSGEITETAGEGELLPETYTFSRGELRDEIIRQAKAAMTKAVREAWQGREAALPLENPREMVVLASIIEKETGVAEERGLVASVFVNRLKKGMRLQTDPTVIYALTQGQQDLGRPLLKKDLEFDSPYNTYKYYGLPPAPICNPGRASLEAAVHPEVSAFLYFVASGNGGHNFARSLNEHNTNVAHWKKNKSSR